jgi:C4-dicarboxylate-specific signal transduction histidine kinase
MEPFWKGRETVVDLELAQGDPYLMGSEAAVESILANLINNSLNAFRKGPTADRKIIIRTAVSDNACSIYFSDSGPGIVDLDIKDIWLPGITSFTDGTGLGLTIVKDTVSDLGGQVSAKAHGELGGAEFEVTLPLIAA